MLCSHRQHSDIVLKAHCKKPATENQRDLQVRAKKNQLDCSLEKYV